MDVTASQIEEIVRQVVQSMGNGAGSAANTADLPKVAHCAMLVAPKKFEVKEIPIPELTDDDIREVPTFVMMRRIGLIECLQYHLNNVDEGSGENAEITPEIMAFFCKGTVMLCRRYIKKFKDMPLASPVAE